MEVLFSKIGDPNVWGSDTLAFTCVSPEDAKKAEEIFNSEIARARELERKEIGYLVEGFIAAVKQIPSIKRQDYLIIVQLNQILNLIRARDKP